MFNQNVAICAGPFLCHAGRSPVAQSLERPSKGPGSWCNSTVGLNHEKDMSSFSHAVAKRGRKFVEILASPFVGERRNKCRVREKIYAMA